MGHARIGRIRLKSGATVIPLHKGALVVSDRRAAFLRQTAASCDSYLLKTGEVPDAMVTVFCGLRQDSHLFWAIRGESEGGASSILALAQSTIQRHLSRDDD